MKFKKAFFICLFVFSFARISAQSSSIITDILNSDRVTFGQVCYLVATHEGLINDTASYTDAINALEHNKMIPYAAYEETYVPLVNLSYLYAQMFKVQGGLMYRIFHGAPRYAYKQLKQDGVLPENSYPGKLVSGQEALNIYTTCSIQYTDFQLNMD